MKNKEVAALLELTNGGTVDVEALPALQAPWHRTPCKHRGGWGRRRVEALHSGLFFSHFLSRERSMERRSGVEFWAYRIGNLNPYGFQSGTASYATKLGRSDCRARRVQALSGPSPLIPKAKRAKACPIDPLASLTGK
jgi:hypothetical protein